LRENFFVGELEVEMQSPIKKKGTFGARGHSSKNMELEIQ
jgi:hypothetical protein